MVYTYATFSAFYRSIETSRIVRVGTRNYIIHMSQRPQWLGYPRAHKNQFREFNSHRVHMREGTFCIKK